MLKRAWRGSYRIGESIEGVHGLCEHLGLQFTAFTRGSAQYGVPTDREDMNLDRLIGRGSFYACHCIG